MPDLVMAGAIIMGMPVDIRLTYEDYCRLPNDGKRYEIIDGELFVTPSPFRPHQRAVTRLTRYLSTFVQENDLGEVFVAPFDVVFSRFDVVEPDLLYVSKGRDSVLTEKTCRALPTWLWKSFLPRQPKKTGLSS